MLNQIVKTAAVDHQHNIEIKISYVDCCSLQYQEYRVPTSDLSQGLGL